MAVSALVLTMQQDRSAAARALAHLTADARVTVGEQREHMVAVVVDTPGSSEDRAAFTWIEGLSGVAQVELVCVLYDDCAADHGSR